MASARGKKGLTRIAVVDAERCRPSRLEDKIWLVFFFTTAVIP